MPTEQEYRRSEEILEIQERFLTDKIKRFEVEIAKLKGTRRRRIVQRSLSLFAGVVLVLFGFIGIIVVQAQDANFNNIIIFTLSEIIAIPLLRYGIVLFRKMPIEQEISAVVAQLVETQDGIAQLREERLRLIRTPVKATRSGPSPFQPGEKLISFDEPQTESSERCPDCGQAIQAGTKICRACGHLFI